MPSNPKCVAIIMDGNARWARARGMSTLEGHYAGTRALKRTVEAAPELGIEELVVYSFSTENWQRSEQEIFGLMTLFAEMIVEETPELNANRVKLRFVGERHGVSEELIQLMQQAEETTSQNSRLKLFVAFNYGGRAEIEAAAERYCKASTEVRKRPFSEFLYVPEMHDPDILIRTSGEKRTSNFLLWQCAYSELVFTDVLWPDFGRDSLAQALEEFRERQRRFGGR